MEKTEFIKDCEKVKNNEMSLQDLYNKYKKNFYINLAIKELVSQWVTDTLKVTLESESEEKKDFYDLIDSNLQDGLFMYEIIKTNFVLSQYLDCGFLTENSLYVYDLTHEIGLVNKVEKETNGDFVDFLRLVDYFTGINNLNALKKEADRLTELPSKEEMENLITQIKNLDSEKLISLLKLQEFSNPTAISLTEEIAKSIKESE